MISVPPPPCSMPSFVGGKGVEIEKKPASGQARNKFLALYPLILKMLRKTPTVQMPSTLTQRSITNTCPLGANACAGTLTLTLNEGFLVPPIPAIRGYNVAGVTICGFRDLADLSAPSHRAQQPPPAMETHPQKIRYGAVPNRWPRSLLSRALCRRLL